MVRLKAYNQTICQPAFTCSKLTIETIEKGVKLFGVFIVNFEHISHFVLVFLLLTLNMWMPTGLMFLIAVKLQQLFMKDN